jgi:hypothetical protein
MLNRAASGPGNNHPRRWTTPSIVLSGVAVFVALGGSAFAANNLIGAKDLATGAVTSKTIKNGGVKPQDLNTRTQAALQGATGATGAVGSAGANGANGVNGLSGVNGANGANGPNGADGVSGVAGTAGVDGTNGVAGTNGANGANGANGPNGPNGVDGIDGIDGVDGLPGIDGADGVLAPLSAKAGTILLPTGITPTVVVEMTIPGPPANYVVFAKTQVTHTGAGDSVVCKLKAGTTTIDQVSMKTLPALAAIPMSLQAVTTTSPTDLSVDCVVSVADGTASFSSLIALPIG